MAPPRQQALSEFFCGSGEKKKSRLSFRRRSVVVKKRKRQHHQVPIVGGTSRISGSRFGQCPICGASFPLYQIEIHAETCDGCPPASKQQQRKTFKKGVVEKPAITDAPRAGNEENDGSLFSNHPMINTHTANLPSLSTEENSSSVQTSWWKAAITKSSDDDGSGVTIENPVLPSDEPIPGLYLYEDFVSKEDEAAILNELDTEALPWRNVSFNGAHRGKRWGVHCNLRDRRVDEPENPLPPFFHTILLPKLKRLEAMQGCIPNEANAIDYRRRFGHFLTPHVDDRQLSKEPIANLSLAGECYMTFQNTKGPSRESRRVLLRRGTLQVLTGRARYDYSHGIRAQDLISDRRVSITMRESPLTLKKGRK